MVNNPKTLDPRILVEGRFDLRAGAADRTKITNGPVYDLTIAQQLVAQFGFLRANADSLNARRRELEPKLDDDEVAEILTALKNEHYDGSEISIISANRKVDSDEYFIWWHRNNRREDPGRMFGIPIYVKFGFRYPSPKCLIVSIHRSERH
ncbi:MAG: hypothetical protein COZ24_08220 [Hydrogenophilales bacterium CG_4_10_14_3_um_filter_63_21]|nr:MAG: hypothetical protein COZ24_08220 [Hydrogenophilales bacterium CG_4_10_14_3_um_filter_63_21]